MKAGLLASFATETALRDALPGLHAARIGDIETYTPTLIVAGQSPLPVIIFMAGMLGAGSGFALQVYANMVAYPLDIGGRPEFSWPAFIPIAFEIGALTAMLAGFVGYLVVNRMPALYQPIDECQAMPRVTQDAWCVAIRTDEPEQARVVLQKLQPITIEEFPA